MATEKTTDFEGTIEMPVDTKKHVKNCRSRTSGREEGRATNLCEGGEGAIPSCGSRSPWQVPWERREDGEANAGYLLEWIANCGGFATREKWRRSRSSIAASFAIASKLQRLQHDRGFSPHPSLPFNTRHFPSIPVTSSQGPPLLCVCASLLATNWSPPPIDIKAKATPLSFIFLHCF